MRECGRKGGEFSLEAVAPDLAALANLVTLAEEAGAYARASRADNTRRAYASDWRAFADWCDVHQLDAMPADPGTVALYLVDCARRLKVSTVSRKLSSIARAHTSNGADPNPCRADRVRLVLAGIRRKKAGTDQGTEEGARALSVEDVRNMAARCRDDVRGKRNRALLLFGFLGALRRSELAALELRDVQQVREGVVVTVRASKTDQEGHGEQKGLPIGRRAATCPQRALAAWLEVRGKEPGPLWGHVNKGGRLARLGICDRTVCEVVRELAGAAGIDLEGISGHSLRAGFMTAGAAAGIEERDLMRQSGHRSLEVARKYIRAGNLFNRNAAGALGL